LKGAQTLFEAGVAEKAVASFQDILKGDPENIEALYGLGLAYVNVGKFQDAANTLQQFADKAPATDSRVAEAKTVIKDLIVGNNLQPPKSESGKGRAAPPKKKP
jgi:cytochrome c-type biogenesis protein CcmH/NrfG